LIGGGIGSSIVWTCMTLSLGIVILTDRQFRCFHCSPLRRSDWPRFRWLFRLAGR
jgi:hypothetical protein